MKQMRDQVLLAGAALIASVSVSVGILVTKYPLPNAAEALSTKIEGVYARSHEVSAVDGGMETAEDVVEIVRYDTTHVFVQIMAHFDNGHSCGLSGIASFEDESFVYRTRQFILDDEPACTLKVELTADELRVTDRLRANGTATCGGFCGARGNLSDFAIARGQQRPILDRAILKSSAAFAAAVEEFTKDTMVRK